MHNLIVIMHGNRNEGDLHDVYNNVERGGF